MEYFDNWNWQVITWALALRYLINLVSIIILIRLIYYSNYKRSDLILTFFSFNTIIFFITYMMNRVEMSTGAAFGLFAVFSILRYRTEGISTKDMTYLFLSIAIGLLTAVSKCSHVEMIIISAAILLLTFLLESNIVTEKENSKTILYDNIQLVHNDQRDNLLIDLKSRTGLDIRRFHINEIDFLKDACNITIFYVEN